jgi:hypothetical protein
MRQIPDPRKPVTRCLEARSAHLVKPASARCRWLERGRAEVGEGKGPCLAGTGSETLPGIRSALKSTHRYMMSFVPVFISYSHSDATFAIRLAQQLVMRNARVWIDKWELHVGDSLIARIQEAIEGASALLVVLSKASVESEWCKKELSTGLIRELEEKRVVVLPVLIDDCKIPLFLRDKLYADFRTSFDQGLNDVLESISRVTSDTLVRLENPQWHVDWGFSWDVVDDRFWMSLMAVEQSVGDRFTVVTEISIVGNDRATERYRAFRRAGLPEVERDALIDILTETAAAEDVRLQISDSNPQVAKFVFGDKASGAEYVVHITARRLGDDTGRDILIDIGGQLNVLRNGRAGRSRPLTEDEQRTVAKIQAEFETKAPRPASYLAF